MCITVHIYFRKYVFIQPLHHEHDVTQGQFLSRVQMVWIHSFSSLSLVAPTPKKLKNQVYPTIYPELWREQMDSCIFKRINIKVKRKQPRIGF